MAEKKRVKPSPKGKKEKQDKVVEEQKPTASIEPEVRIPARLSEFYKKEIVPELMKKFGYKSIMQAPKLHKIVVNMGVGAAVSDPKIMEEAVRDIESITGQKSTIRKSKKAISNFKLREDQPIGLMVTLRGKRMYDFLDRFCHIVAPRIRDFRGFNKKGDGRGNYNFGLEDQQVFPEINLDKVKRTQGMNITVVTSAKSDEDCIELLSLLGFPFK